MSQQRLPVIPAFVTATLWHFFIRDKQVGGSLSMYVLMVGLHGESYVLSSTNCMHINGVLANLYGPKDLGATHGVVSSFSPHEAGGAHS